MGTVTFRSGRSLPDASSQPAVSVPAALYPVSGAREVALYLLIASVYVATGRLGLSLALVQSNASAVWPPSGIAVAAVLLFGPRVWPAIAVGAFITNTMTAGNMVTASVIAAGDTLEAFAGAWLMATRLPVGPDLFSRTRHVFAFILFACIVGLIGSTVGVTTQSASGFATWRAYPAIWVTWWLGNSAGIIVFTPLILLWACSPVLRLSPRRWVELGLLTVSLLGVGWTVFLVVDYPLQFLCIPLCVWAGFRFGQRIAASAACVLSLIAVGAAANGLGVFAASSTNTGLLVVEVFIAVSTLVGLAVAAAVSERNAMEHRVRQLNDTLERRVAARTAELAAVEARLEEAQEVASVGSWEWQAHDGQVWWSDEIYRIFGIARQVQPPTYEEFIAGVHPDDRGATHAAQHHCCLTCEPFEVEHRVIRPDGEVRTVISKGRADVDGNGVLTRMVGTTQDITGRKQLEERLRQSQKMEAVGRLAGGVAHDFNNLLTAINGYAELLLARPDNDAALSEDLEQVRKAASSATALSRQLLLFSRNQPLRTELLDLNDLIRGIETLLRRTLGEDVRIVTTLAPDLRRIEANAVQIDQVLMNLALNARDAMPLGGTLTLTTANVDGSRLPQDVDALRGRGYVELTVADTGHGMDHATRAHIFEPFFTTKERGHAAGLGLATVYGIVQQSGGAVHVTSEVGRGTSFRLYFPEHIAPPRHVPALHTQTAAPVGGGEHLLVVEDDAHVRAFVGRVLRQCGYQVREAESPAAALEYVDGNGSPIDLVLTDVVMPGMSGYDLAVLLRRKHPTLRLLFMSGYSDRAVPHDGVPIHAGQLLEKPFTTAVLLHKVREMLDSR